MCGLVIAGGYERNVVWVRSGKKIRIIFTQTHPLTIFAPSKKKAVRAAHKAGVRAVTPRESVLLGIVGGWQKLARYQFKHGLPQ